MIIFHTGNHPDIAIAEIRAVYGFDNVFRLGDHLVAVDSEISDEDLLAPAERLGSVMRIIRTAGEVAGHHDDVAKRIARRFTPEVGKVTVGLSVFDQALAAGTATRLVRQALTSVKEELKRAGNSVRTINPDRQPILSTATVLHDGLTRNLTKKAEFTIIHANNGKYYLGQTIFVFNADHYARRDQARPYRDARNGMLPPKLAQTIINLAVEATDKSLRDQLVVLDPFCGTGVVLQESLLMDFDCLGTDLNPIMTNYSQKNITWLQEQRFYTNREHRGKCAVATGDATNFDWRSLGAVTTVACEAYLGQPYFKPPRPEALQNNIDECDRIIGATLRNLATQLPSGAGLCLGVPAWFIGDTHRLLPITNELASLGYHNLYPSQPLIYRRPNQIVGRHLLVLQKS